MNSLVENLTLRVSKSEMQNAFHMGLKDDIYAVM